MIPVELTVQGLYSYKKKQTIPFDQLTSAGLFGIFGGVGSGKSSLLEAITFALYKRTERLNITGDDRYYNMMNLKSDEMLIDFQFRTGPQQQLYRATVNLKRIRNDFRRTAPISFKAYRQEQEQWLPIDHDSLPGVIGLSYDNFKRTIIIPQGRFQEFLQMSSTDRTRMMKELFGLERFDLFRNASWLESRNKLQISELKGQLMQIEAVDEQMIITHTRQLEEMNKALLGLQKQLEGDRNEEVSLKNLRDISLKLQQVKDDLSRRLDAQEQMQELEKRTGDYEFCMLTFSSLLKDKQEALGRQHRLKVAITTDQQSLKKTLEDIAVLEKEYKTVSQEWQKREEYEKRAAELMLLLQVRLLHKQAHRQQEQVQALKDKQMEILEQAHTLNQQETKANELLQHLRESLPDMAQLAEARAWHEKKQQLQEMITRDGGELQQAREKLRQIVEKKKEAWQTPFLDDIPFETEAPVLERILSKKPEEYQKEARLIDNRISQLALQVKLQDYASSLTHGEPCPLCGATEHPSPLNGQDATGELARLSMEKEQQEQMASKVSQVFNNIRLLHERISDQQATLGNIQKRQQAQQQALETHLQAFVWKQYHTREAVAEAFAQADSLKKQVQEQEALLKKLREEINRLSGLREHQGNQLQQEQMQEHKLATRAETLLSQLQLTSMEEYQGVTPEAIGQEADGLKQRSAHIKKEHERITAELNLQAETRNTLQTRLKMNDESLQTETASLEKINTNLFKRLRESAYNDLEQVKAVLDQDIDLRECRKLLDEWKSQVKLLRARQQDLTEAMADRTYDAPRHEQLLETIEQSTRLLTTMNQEKGRLDTELAKMKKDLETINRLSEKLTQLEKRAEDIATLKELFRSSGFVNYISSIYLQELCRAANEKFFTLTRQQLSLELAEDNSFLVRDFINDGKLRSVKTLSGGQTFQAALSLALALADNIQKIAGSSENFFFLDEGFGSLDQDTLRVVFDTLKALRKEQRIVGVISHVGAMQQEIDAHLVVRLDEEEGSVVKSSLG